MWCGQTSKCSRKRRKLDLGFVPDWKQTTELESQVEISFWDGLGSKGRVSKPPEAPTSG